MGSHGIQMPSAYEVADVPSGLGICTRLPYAFIVPELVFGVWVWILVAATRVATVMSQGWVMYVSVSCFFFSMLLLMVYLFGFHKKNCGTWRIVDVIYHGIAAMFYLSAAVLQANATIMCDQTSQLSCGGVLINYRLNTAATVFAFVTTLFYTLHSFQSYVQ